VSEAAHFTTSPLRGAKRNARRKNAVAVRTIAAPETTFR
jgi:hypothetical protein